MKWKSILFKDFARKLLALCFAGFVWWFVNQAITVQRPARFVVQEVKTAGLPTSGTLQVRPPAGWQLADPSPGDEVVIWFEGARERLETFLESEPAAAWDAATDFRDPGKDVSTFSTEVRPTNLRWRRPEDALHLLSGIGSQQTVLKITLARRESIDFSLDRSIVHLTGTPADGYRILADGLSLDSTAITLTGPWSEVHQLLDKFERWRTRGGLPPPLLESLSVTGARETLRRDLHLHATLASAGVAMDPSSISVEVPVVLERLEPFRFLPSELARFGQAPAGIWQDNFTPRPWLISAEDRPDLGFLELDESWVRRHVRLYLPMEEIPESAPEFDLPIRWSLVHISDPARATALRKALDIHPEKAEDGIVRMTRLAEDS